MNRTASIHRVTSESDVEVTVDLDGTGVAAVTTGVGFYDHMRTAMSKHSLIDRTVEATGDVHIDGHHVIGGVEVDELVDGLSTAIDGVAFAWEAADGFGWDDRFMARHPGADALPHTGPPPDGSDA